MQGVRCTTRTFVRALSSFARSVAVVLGRVVSQGQWLSAKLLQHRVVPGRRKALVAS